MFLFNDYNGMRILNGNTRIKLYQIKEFKELIEDAKRYKIGEISTRTGLQKCLVNGNIVWLLPNQKSNFNQGKLNKADTILLAKSAKKARADGYLKNTGNVKQDATQYLNYMKSTWNKNPVKARYLNNAKVRLNNMSYKHLFESKGKLRSLKEVKQRAECLPYVRDILERSGKPSDHIIKNGKESYTIVGKAIVNNKQREIQVVISRDQKSRYFYLSVFKLKNKSQCVLELRLS